MHNNILLLFTENTVKLSVLDIAHICTVKHTQSLINYLVQEPL